MDPKMFILNKYNFYFAVNKVDDRIIISRKEVNNAVVEQEHLSSPYP